MNRARTYILILGPLPIVAGWLALGAIFRAPPPAVVARNDVVELASFDHTPDAAPLQLATFDSATGDLARRCEQTAEELRGRLGPQCSVVAYAPCVIGGDLDESQLRDWQQHTIEPALRAMAHSYFDAPPTAPITVLLFSGERSYNHYTHALFNDSDISIYGYYKPQSRTLVMNIATGGGTLIHELTHALMAFDFPKVPDWFNEGLASLHEQCRFREVPNGSWIEGLVNWRLEGLQKVIKQQKLRSVRALVEDRAFRGRDEGTNYAHARYFCLYLQRQGLLEKYFHEFRRAHVKDPSGLNTLASLFPGETWDEIDRKFEKFVLELEP